MNAKATIKANIETTGINVTTSEITTNRNIDLIAAEINTIKDQTKKQVIYNSIEIGRRLVEAKEIIAHGEWSNWLEKSVDYSQRTATNLMKIFTEYGADQITLLNNNSKQQSLADLSYTQAIALLGIPAEEREEFIQVNDIEAMSTRELQQAIKAKEKAEKEKEKFKKLANEKSEEAKKMFEDKMKAESDRLLTDKVLWETQADFKALQLALQKEKDNSKNAIEQLEKNISETKKQLAQAQVSGNDEEVQRLQSSLLEIQKDLDSSAQRIDQLEAELKNKTIDVITAEPIVIKEIPEDIQLELEDFRKKAILIADQSIIRFKIYCEQLQKTFTSQLELMDELKNTNPETYDKCKNAILNLVNKIAEGL